jgi:predicted enzyme related to lactoylglutathione lyase
MDKEGQMAKRKSVKKKAKKVARKVAKKAAKKRSATRRPKRAVGASRKAAARKARKVAAPKLRDGVITHTELASADPPATRSWCERVLGWKFGQAMPTPTGLYHMWQFENGTGGGIRANNPPEVPGSIPYCEVADIQATYSKALVAGATEMLRPEQLPGGMGWIAIIAAPGGVAIGFWARK